MTKWLNLEHVKDICFVFAQTHLAFDEPIPPFETRFPGKIEAILAIPQQEFGGKRPYPKLTEQAGALFYSLIKEHPFLNGNKRIAVICLLFFLAINDSWLRLDWELLYETAVSVARSDPKKRGLVLKELSEMMTESLVKLEKSSPNN